MVFSRPALLVALVSLVLVHAPGQYPLAPPLESRRASLIGTNSPGWTLLAVAAAGAAGLVLALKHPCFADET